MTTTKVKSCLLHDRLESCSCHNSSNSSGSS